MNPYALEMLARERQREMLQEAELRRQVALARAQSAGGSPSSPRFAAVTAIAGALRALIVPRHEPQIERPGLGDAS
jgi:hypothetical protein